MFFYVSGSLRPFIIETETCKTITLDDVLKIEKEYPNRRPIFEYNFGDSMDGCSIELLEEIQDYRKREGSFKAIVFAPDRRHESEIICDYMGPACFYH